MNKQKYFWVAILDNNDTIMEFNPDGTENLYQDLPRKDVKFFGLQGPQNNYILDLTNGRVTIQNNGNNKFLDIKLPLKGGLTNICEPLNGQKYNFFQWKKGHTDFTLGATTGSNVIDEHIIGWKRMKILPQLGPCLIELNLNIKPLEINSKPKLQIIIRKNEGGARIAGSPFEITI